MRENLKVMRRNQKGFSLVELIIVIAIMAILLGVLAPQYVKYVEKSREAKDEETAEELIKVARVMATDEEYAVKIQENDTITFNASGVQTNNADIQNIMLPELLAGWQSLRVKSKEYKNKTYKIVFHLDTATDSRMAIAAGWN